MKLRTKVMLLVVVPILICTMTSIGVLVATGSRLESKLTEDAKQNTRQQINQNIQMVFSLINTHHLTLTSQLHRSLSIANEYLRQRGGLHQSEKVREHVWQAKNQFTNEILAVNLGELTLGGHPIEITDDPKTHVEAVDNLNAMIGTAITIFQRMNEAGDMIRVATTVPDNAGKRAIGTFIPHIMKDGTENLVLGKVLRGETYVGKAIVNGQTYMTGYQPVFGNEHKVIAITSIGVPVAILTKDVENTIKKMKVGKTGYAFVLGATEKNRGQYIVSKDGKRDGENIWEAKDTNGNFFIKDMIEGAMKTQENGLFESEYFWKNADEQSARKKTAATIYFAPWDWVIGSGAYDEDFNDGLIAIVAGLTNMKTSTIVASALVGLLTLICGFFFSRPILAALDQVITILHDSSAQVSSTAQLISSSSMELAKVATEQASSLEETSAAIEEMNSMVSKNADASRQTSKISQTSGDSAYQGKVAVDEMKSATKEIDHANSSIMTQTIESHEKLAQIVKVISEIGEKTKVINEIVFQTKLLSFNASVEAARAGEHGKGFAVVAQEVGNLAHMSGNAAKEITTMLDFSIQKVEGIVIETKTSIEKLVADSKAKVEVGNECAIRCGEVLDEIVSNVSRVSQMSQAISTATDEQAHGISEITKAVTQLDRMTQQNAAAAEQTSSATEELAAQAEQMNGAVNILVNIVHGEAVSETHVSLNPRIA